MAQAPNACQPSANPPKDHTPRLSPPTASGPAAQPPSASKPRAQLPMLSGAIVTPPTATSKPRATSPTAIQAFAVVAWRPPAQICINGNPSMVKWLRYSHVVLAEFAAISTARSEEHTSEL